MSAHYEHTDVHADDCADGEDPNKGFTEAIKSDVRIVGKFNDTNGSGTSSSVVGRTRHWQMV